MLLVVIFTVNGLFHYILHDKHSEIDSKEITYIQKNARLALAILSHDIQYSGFKECSKNNTVYVNPLATKIMGFIGSAGIRGFNGSTSNAELPDSIRALAKPNTDALLTLQSEWYSGVQDGSQIASNKYDESTINNNTEQKNKSHNEFDLIEKPCVQNFLGHIPAQPQVSRLQSNSYFVSNSQELPELPALVRQSIVIVDGDITTNIEEITSGIENIQFKYGIDTNANGVINEYRDADKMDINNDGSIDDEDWQQVLTVKIEMLLISKGPVFKEPQTVIFNGIEYPGLFMRQVVSTDVQVKHNTK